MSAAARLVALITLAAAPLAPAVAQGAEPRVRNGDFERWQAGRPAIWRYDVGVPAAGDAKGIMVDAKVRHGGRYAARVRFAEAMSYAGVIQEIDVVALRGRTISLSGYVRRANPKSTVGVWMLLADENGKRLDYVNSYKMPLAKAGDWGRYETRLALPANAARLKFGAAVFDADGTAWIDDIALSVVPAAPAAPGRAEELSK